MLLFSDGVLVLVFWVEVGGLFCVGFLVLRFSVLLFLCWCFCVVVFVVVFWCWCFCGRGIGGGV